MKRTVREEDDFVLTLSDNDNDDGNVSIESRSESDTEQPNSAVTTSTNGKKRKQPDSSTKSVDRKKKSNKKARVQIATATAAISDGEEEEERDEEQDAAKDAAFDSEFEFEVNGIVDQTEEFDGWGDGGLSVSKNGTRRVAVDVDEIIARRAAQKEKKREKLRKRLGNEPLGDDNGGDLLDGANGVSDLEEEQADSESEDGLKIDFDDEILADDAFGAGAQSEDESSGDDSDATSDIEGQDSQDMDGDASDNDSVASPVAHPDDAAAESDSELSEVDAAELAKQKAFFAPEKDHSGTTNGNTGSFQQFSLSRPILRGLAALSFSTPTPIQTRTIPIALQGLDVVGSAQTGSGKTAAFLLPILERLLYRPRRIPTTRVAILMPTRELAVQCYAVAVALAKYTDITFAQVVGGFSLREQETILKKRPDVVIATPGRFIDHMRNSASFVVENLEILVLDEADRMLDQGFADELDEILKTIPRSRQTMLFSATMTSSVDKLVRVGMNKPVRVSVDSSKSTVAGLTQEFLRLRPGKEDHRLASLCTLVTTIPDYQQRTIIFFRQKKDAHRIRVVFGLLGLKASELHGSMTQDQRIAAVTSFRDGKTTHLLATDVASRGLDIKNVHSVINYEAPATHEIYLHRVGRTARAGKSGKSCTIAAEPDRKLVKQVVKAAAAAGKTPNSNSGTSKITSRILDPSTVSNLSLRLQSLDPEIEEILHEEKQEKHLVQLEEQVTRGQNLIRHQAEIQSRPRRTWFESEREKIENQQRARVEVGLDRKKKEGGGRLSGKDRKKLDLRRERVEGRMWKKGKERVDSKGKDKKSGKGRKK